MEVHDYINANKSTSAAGDIRVLGRAFVHCGSMRGKNSICERGGKLLQTTHSSESMEFVVIAEVRGCNPHLVSDSIWQRQRQLSSSRGSVRFQLSRVDLMNPKENFTSNMVRGVDG